MLLERLGFEFGERASFRVGWIRQVLGGGIGRFVGLSGS